MKTILFAGLVAGVSLAPCAAQQQGAEGKKKRVPLKALRLVAPAPRKAPDQAELKKRFDSKMKEAWVSNANWVTDFDDARSQAKETGKLIFAYFTRSYAP